MADAETPKKSRIRKPVLTASERKRRKRERGRVQQRTRVVLGGAYERWCLFKVEQGLPTDRAVAECLLDNWHAKSKSSDRTTQYVEPTAGTLRTGMHKFSVPFSVNLPEEEEETPSMSEIPEVKIERDLPMSDDEEVSSSSAEDINILKREKYAKSKSGDRTTQYVEPTSSTPSAGMHIIVKLEEETPSESEIPEVKIERDLPMSDVEEVSSPDAEAIKTVKRENPDIPGPQ